MIFLTVILLILVVILMFQLNNTNVKLNQFDESLSTIFKTILKLNSDISNLSVSPKKEPVITQQPPQTIITPEPIEIKVNESISTPIQVEEPVIGDIKVETEDVTIFPSTDPEQKSTNEKTPIQETWVSKPAIIIEEPEPSFFERHPDLEKFIGENLINKIGIGILVIGIGFFVKYAIDQEWINEIGRVAIGILCGGILLGIAHNLRKTLKAFSSVLIGGGMSVLYFTIAIAFHQYQLLNQTASFIIMVLITAFTILLSISYDRKELAILAMLGGFSSPFMVSTGEGDYIVLFTYILILNAGILALAFKKKWTILNILAYAFTILLFGSWLLIKYFNMPDIPVAGAFIFATLFYFIFFVMNVISNLKEKKAFLAIDISILLSNTVLYYAAGMFILSYYQEGALQGLFTALIAIYNFIFVVILFRNTQSDKNLFYLLTGIVLTFISLAAPIQLKGNYITLFWAAEAVLLLWLSQKSNIRLIKQSSALVTGLMIISLIMDWVNIYSFQVGDTSLTILLNKGFITGAFSVCSLFGTIYFLKQEKESIDIIGFEVQSYKTILKFLTTIILYLVCLFELNYQLIQFIEDLNTIYIILGLYNLAYLIGLFIFTNKRFKDNNALGNLMLSLGAVGLLSYLIFYNHAIVEIRDAYLLNQVAFANFLFHYLDVVFLSVLLYLWISKIKQLHTFSSTLGKFALVFFSFVIVFICSTELDHVIMLNTYISETSIYNTLKASQKISYPILWGICSFIFMTIGMRKRIKVLRIISLSLFLIILLKLFIVDIKDLSEGGKIAAFISLGVLLLVVSFMYQKLKNIILKDEEEKS